MKNKEQSRGVQVWAVMKKEDDPENIGQQRKVAFWANRPPLNLRQDYECFSSQEAFDEHCKMNNIYTRKV